MLTIKFAVIKCTIIYIPITHPEIKLLNHNRSLNRVWVEDKMRVWDLDLCIIIVTRAFLCSLTAQMIVITAFS